MIMQEQDNNTFTKEKTDVEKYLARIIQRYFETENNYSKASIESIIVESLTRFKRFCKDKGKGYLFSLNQKTGRVCINIGFFSGELAFDKNSAFNKDFGIDADTVCSGDDPRLSDERLPLVHSHELTEIHGLESILEQLEVPEYMHSHKNKSTLDALEYTGTTPEIDLFVIEQTKKQLPMYQTNVSKITAGMTTFQKQQLDNLNSSMHALKTYVDNIAINLVFGYQWVQDMKKSINSSSQLMQKYAEKKFLKMVWKDDYQKAESNAVSVYSLANNGSFNVHMTVDGIKNITHNGLPYVVYNVVSDSATIQPITADCLANMYFQYEDDNGDTIQSPLPFTFQDEVGGSIVIQCNIEGDTVTYRTLALTRLSGQGAYSKDYKNGESFILRTKNNKLNFYNSINYAEDNGYSFIEYNPSDVAQNELIKVIAGSDSLHIGAFFDEDVGLYIGMNGNPCKFTSTKNNEQGVVYYEDGELYDAMNTRTHDQLYEIQIPKLEDLYKNPRIYYEVFKKGGVLNENNAG